MTTVLYLIGIALLIRFIENALILLGLGERGE